MGLMDDLYLFEPDPPSVSHSATSRAAAQAMKPNVNMQHQRILAALKRIGPMTDEEIALAANLSPNSARPRRIELLRLGRISPAGEGRTSSGRKAQLWRVS